MFPILKNALKSIILTIFKKFNYNKFLIYFFNQNKTNIFIFIKQ